MKWAEISPELKKRILEQERKDNRDRVGLRPSVPQPTPPEALERRKSKAKRGRPRLEFRVTLVALRPRLLDDHDNAKSAFKALVDVIAETIGVRDDDPRIEWNLEQLKSKSQTTLVIIEDLNEHE